MSVQQYVIKFVSPLTFGPNMQLEGEKKKMREERKKKKRIV